MFDIITKRECWEWIDAGLADPPRMDLKGIQAVVEHRQHARHRIARYRSFGELRPIREVSQSVSIEAEWTKY
jgi:hypothetical protein